MAPAAPPVHVISEVNEMGSCSSPGRCHGRCVGSCFNVVQSNANEMGACSSSSQLFGCRTLLLQRLSDPRLQKNGASANFNPHLIHDELTSAMASFGSKEGGPNACLGSKDGGPRRTQDGVAKRPPGICPKRVRDQRREPKPDRPGSAQRLPRWVWDGGRERNCARARQSWNRIRGPLAPEPLLLLP